MKYILILTVLLTSTAFAAPDFDETMALAKQGNSWGQLRLAIMYDKGEGIPENDVEAVKWYRKAAVQGDPDAQHNLGAMYYVGDGVTENNISAYVWLSMAKTHGNLNAAKSLEILKPHMTKQQIAVGQALAAKCYESDRKDCEMK